MTITKLVSKCARGINEQLLKTSGADVLSSMKKKPQRETNPARPLYVRGLIIFLLKRDMFNLLLDTIFNFKFLLALFTSSAWK